MNNYAMEKWIHDYCRAKREARYWARIAIANKKDGLDWHDAAKNAHASLSYALLIS
jgi:hypothetical protein